MADVSDKARLRLGAYSLGLLTNKPLKRALSSIDIDLVVGPIDRDLDAVAAWGNSPTSQRAISAGLRRNLPVVYLEDAFLRSITPDESEPLIGLTFDRQAPYFDANRPTDLEDLLNAATPETGPNLAYDEYLDSQLSKYNAACAPQPDEHYVLVVDQLKDDASIKLGQAEAKDFALALEAALDENPDVPVFVKPHPRSQDGHFDYGNLPTGVFQLPANSDPILAVKGATNVYCVTSQLGFEAILHGKRPRVFGIPFYAAWGLSADEKMCVRRNNLLSREMLFRTVFQSYCRWFDPLTGEATNFVDALRGLHARRKLHILRSRIGVAAGFARWKRPWMKRLLPGIEFVSIANAGERASDLNVDCAVWASKSTSELVQDCAKNDVRLWRVEDGFVRSNGLGAELTPPGSLVFDDQGIYYDPSRTNLLRQRLELGVELPEHKAARATTLHSKLIEGAVSKYNLRTKRSYDFPQEMRKILVPGQVEDDASILKGSGSTKSNIELLRRTREANPDAFIAYKPHPDVEATLRSGAYSERELNAYCDQVLYDCDPIYAIDNVDEVWTITSLLGFEALIRRKVVVCFGRPFYSGLGLTTDSEGEKSERQKTIGLTSLIHGALIEYPMYFCANSGIALSAEQHLEAITSEFVGKSPRQSRLLFRFWRFGKQLTN